MSRWFRFYDDALDDPKVQALPGDLFKTWVNLLCIASKNGGRLPMDDLPFLLRMDSKKTLAAVSDLLQRGLVDDVDGEAEPHNWNARQYKSDVSKERVQRHRQRKRNGDGNVTSTVTGNDDDPSHATPPDTETETDTDLELSQGETVTGLSVVNGGRKA